MGNWMYGYRCATEQGCINTLLYSEECALQQGLLLNVTR